MSFDTVMVGELQLPQEQTERWLSSQVCSIDVPWLVFLGGSRLVTSTPEALMTAVSETAVAPHELNDFEFSSGRLTVHARVSKDIFFELIEPLAMLYASAARVGAGGTLTVSGHHSLPFGYRIHAGWGRAKLKALSTDQLEAFAQSRPGLRVEEKLRHRMDMMLERPVQLASSELLFAAR
jgi:hypothetical protein